MIITVCFFCQCSYTNTYCYLLDSFCIGATIRTHQQIQWSICGIFSVKLAHIYISEMILLVPGKPGLRVANPPRIATSTNHQRELSSSFSYTFKPFACHLLGRLEHFLCKNLLFIWETFQCKNVSFKKLEQIYVKLVLSFFSEKNLPRKYLKIVLNPNYIYKWNVNTRQLGKSLGKIWQDETPIKHKYFCIYKMLSNRRVMMRFMYFSIWIF